MMQPIDNSDEDDLLHLCSRLDRDFKGVFFLYSEMNLLSSLKRTCHRHSIQVWV